LGDMTKWGLYEPDWVFVEPDRSNCPTRYHNHTCARSGEQGPWAFPTGLWGDKVEGEPLFHHWMHDDNLEGSSGGEPPYPDACHPPKTEGDCSVFSRFKYYLKGCMMDGNGVCSTNPSEYQNNTIPFDNGGHCVCDMCNWYTEYFRPIVVYNELLNATNNGIPWTNGCSNEGRACSGWDDCGDGDPNSCESGPLLPDNVVCHSYKQADASDYNLEIDLDCGGSPLRNLSSNINEIHRLKNEFKTESVSEYVLLPSGNCEWMTCGLERCPYPPCP